MSHISRSNSPTQRSPTPKSTSRSHRSSSLSTSTTTTSTDISLLPSSTSQNPVVSILSSSSPLKSTKSRENSSPVPLPASSLKLLVGGRVFETNCDVLMNQRGGKESFLRTMALLHLQNGMKPRYFSPFLFLIVKNILFPNLLI